MQLDNIESHLSNTSCLLFHIRKLRESLFLTGIFFQNYGVRKICEGVNDESKYRIFF